MKMAEICSFRRVVLKLSGEALKQEETSALHGDAVSRVSQQTKQLRTEGVETAIVVGGGNFLRGVSAVQTGLSRNTADTMGMMGTVINALALRDVLTEHHVPAVIQTPFEMPGVADVFDARKADQLLAEGNVLLLAGGTGHPYFTTDTTAALRACEIQADVIIKATKVDGVYSEDPVYAEKPSRYRFLSYEDALKNNIAVMDATAFSLCRENNMPVVVLNFATSDGIESVLNGDLRRATLVSSDHETELSE